MQRIDPPIIGPAKLSIENDANGVKLRFSKPVREFTIVAGALPGIVAAMIQAIMQSAVNAGVAAERTRNMVQRTKN